MSPNLRVAVVLGLLVCVTGSGAQAQDYRVLPGDFNLDKTQQMMRAYLRRQAHSAQVADDPPCGQEQA